MDTTTLQLPRQRAAHQKLLLMPLMPVLRAYLLGYASSAGPRIIALILKHFGRRKDHNDTRLKGLLPSLIRILKEAFTPRRFPTFCALLVGMSASFHAPIWLIIGRLNRNLSGVVRLRLSRWISTFIAAYLSIHFLQSRKGITSWTACRTSGDNKALAGKTLDLTLFAVLRAVDILLVSLRSGHKNRGVPQRKDHGSLTIKSILPDTIVFMLSSAIIMWTFFYNPSCLPPSYKSWITSAASVDPRLLTALRLCRQGDIIYGQDTGQAQVLQAMCKDYGMPLTWGDPTKSIPYPCEIVHMGTGPNCEYHALVRFKRSYVWAFKRYFPLNILLLLRKKISKAHILRVMLSSARSSAFLATFISLYYYGVCLCRSRLGPLFLGTSTQARQKIDSGYCVATGCLLCGWGVLLERSKRRTDIALFVVPRALATILPRRYNNQREWIERVAFAFSTAVVFTAVKEKPERVRGVLGRVLARVLR